MRCVFWKNSLGLSQRRGEAAKRPQARGGGGGEPEDTGPGGWVGGSAVGRLWALGRDELSPGLNRVEKRSKITVKIHRLNGCFS